MKWFTIIGLTLGLIGAVLIAFSLEIKDAFPLDKSSVQFNIIETNGRMVSRTEASYTSIKTNLFYPGIILLIIAYLLQLIGLWFDR